MSLDHRIDRLTFAIDLAGRDQAEALQDRLSDFAALRLPGLLSEVMDAAGATDLRLDRLALDLGDIPAPFLEDDLARRFEAALSAALRAHRDAAGGDPQEDPPPYGAQDVPAFPEGLGTDAPGVAARHEEGSPDPPALPWPETEPVATAPPARSDAAERDAPQTPPRSALAGETALQATGAGEHSSPHQHHAPRQAADPSPPVAPEEQARPAAQTPEHPSPRIRSGLAAPSSSVGAHLNAQTSIDPGARARRAAEERDHPDRPADRALSHPAGPNPSRHSEAPDHPADPADHARLGPRVPPPSADADETEGRASQSPGQSGRAADRSGHRTPTPTSLGPSALPLSDAPRVQRDPAAPGPSASPEEIADRTLPGLARPANPRKRTPDSAAALGVPGLGEGYPAVRTPLPPAILRDLAHYLRHGTYPTWPGPGAPDLATLLARGLRDTPVELHALLSKIGDHPAVAARLAHHNPPGLRETLAAPSAVHAGPPVPPEAPGPEDAIAPTAGTQTTGEGAPAPEPASGDAHPASEKAGPRAARSATAGPARSAASTPSASAADPRPGQSAASGASEPRSSSEPPSEGLNARSAQTEGAPPPPEHAPRDAPEPPPATSGLSQGLGPDSDAPHLVPPTGRAPTATAPTNTERPGTSQGAPRSDPDRGVRSGDLSPGSALDARDPDPRSATTASNEAPTSPNTEKSGPATGRRAAAAVEREGSPVEPDTPESTPTDSLDISPPLQAKQASNPSTPRTSDAAQPTTASPASSDSSEDRRPPLAAEGEPVPDPAPAADPPRAPTHIPDPAQSEAGDGAHARHRPGDTADPPLPAPEPHTQTDEPLWSRARLTHLLAAPDARAALLVPPDWPWIEAAHLALLPRLGGFAVTLLRAAASEAALGPRLAEASLTVLAADPPPQDARDWLAAVLRNAGAPDPTHTLSASAKRLAPSDRRFAPLRDLLHPPPDAAKDDAADTLIARFLEGAPTDAATAARPPPDALAAALDRLGHARVEAAMVARLDADQSGLLAQVLPLLARADQVPVTASDLPLVTLLAWARATDPQTPLEFPALLDALTRLAATRAATPAEAMRDRIAQTLQAVRQSPDGDDTSVSEADLSRLLKELEMAQAELSLREQYHLGAPGTLTETAGPDPALPAAATPSQERRPDRLDDPLSERAPEESPQPGMARAGPRDRRVPISDGLDTGASAQPHSDSGDPAAPSPDPASDAPRTRAGIADAETLPPAQKAVPGAGAAQSGGADPSTSRTPDLSSDRPEAEPLQTPEGRVLSPPPDGPRADADASEAAQTPGAGSPVPGSRRPAEATRAETRQGPYDEPTPREAGSGPVEPGALAPRDPDSAGALPPPSNTGAEPQVARRATDTPPNGSSSSAAAGQAAPDARNPTPAEPEMHRTEPSAPDTRPATGTADAPFASSRAAQHPAAASAGALGEIARQVRDAGLVRNAETSMAQIARAHAVEPIDGEGGPEEFFGALAAILGISRAELADGLAPSRHEAKVPARPDAGDVEAALFRTARALRRAGLNLDPPALSAHLDAAHGAAPIDAAEGPRAFHAALAASLGMPVQALVARLSSAPPQDAEAALFRTAQALRRAGLNLDPPVLSAHLDAAHGVAPIDASEGPDAFHAALAASLGMPVDALVARLSAAPGADPAAPGSQGVLLRMARELRRAGVGVDLQPLLATLRAAHNAAPWDAPDGPDRFLAEAAERLAMTPETLAPPLAAAQTTPDPTVAAEPAARQDTHTGLAGLVLLHVHVQTYLARSDCLDPAGALPEAQRARAVHLLGLLASGRMDLPEHELALPKLLCGMPLGMPLPPGPEATPEEAELAESLLRFTASQVPAFENTDPAGLRETFVLRHGVIRRDAPDAPLTLQVTKGPFDMLLGGIPWPWSVVSLPWMPEALHVTWT